MILYDPTPITSEPQLLRALISSDVFNLYAGALLASVKARVNFPDCYPVVSDRVCQFVFACFVIKHSAHCAQGHKVLSAYVNNALACLKP